MPINNVTVLSARHIDAGGEPRARLVPPELRGAASITILIHGFNNSKEVAERSFRRFLATSALARSGVAGRVCVFYWPGDHGWYRYYQEISRAKQSAVILARYLSTIAGESSLDVSLVCHSLGNRVALELIAECRRNESRVRFRRAAMMAAAVPLHFVERGGALYDAARAVDRREVFYSHSDLALGVAFTGGQLMAGEPCTGAVGKSGGPARVWTASTDFTPYEHSDYWPEPESALSVQAMFGLATVRYLPRRSRPQRETLLSRMPRRETPSRTLFPFDDH